ncbi:hypothetical protein JTB14_011436 [Gonioctena quinquepunctata]|nr:hypothetical protein JTB14_011436 [Gonioctena quinquepunctata]
METKSGSSTTVTDDIYEFKCVKDGDDTSSDELKSSGTATNSSQMGVDVSDPLSIASPIPQQLNEDTSIFTAKRGYPELSDQLEDSCGSGTGTIATSTVADDETRRKKRKDDSAKDGKSIAQRNMGQSKGQNSKQSTGGQNKSLLQVESKVLETKSPCSSPKPTVSDAEVEDGKTDLKVPPLKIVIPQTTSNEQDTGAGRNGKSSSQRTHQALPYVVTSSSSTDSNNEKEIVSTAGNLELSTTSNKGEEKKEIGNNILQEELKVQSNDEAETSISAITSTPPSSAPAPVELHPRKRKIKQNKDQATLLADTQESPAETQVHPHEQPITNCYQLFLNIRNQIGKRRRGLFPVQPKPPQGFKDYLMNRCTYVLAGTAPTSPNITYPQNLLSQMKDLFSEQEKERYRLRTQHVIEKEKLVLSVEQEILRVHGRAARALANQSLPFSVCSILTDEEVYNLITPEQEEKDRNARSRYNEQQATTSNVNNANSVASDPKTTDSPAISDNQISYAIHQAKTNQTCRKYIELDGNQKRGNDISVQET